MLAPQSGAARHPGRLLVTFSFYFNSFEKQWSLESQGVHSTWHDFQIQIKSFSHIPVSKWKDVGVLFFAIGFKYHVLWELSAARFCVSGPTCFQLSFNTSAKDAHVAGMPILGGVRFRHVHFVNNETIQGQNWALVKNVFESESLWFTICRLYFCTFLPLNKVIVNSVISFSFRVRNSFISRTIWYGVIFAAEVEQYSCLFGVALKFLFNIFSQESDLFNSRSSSPGALLQVWKLLLYFSTIRLRTRGSKTLNFERDTKFEICSITSRRSGIFVWFQNSYYFSPVPKLRAKIIKSLCEEAL